jgi:hypothetical protein
MIMKQSRVFNPPKWVLGRYSDRLLDLAEFSLSISFSSE